MPVSLIIILIILYSSAALRLFVFYQIHAA